MAYLAQSPTADASSFEYQHPLMHNGYSDPYSTFNAYNAHQAHAPTHHDGLHSPYPPAHDSQATAFSTLTSHHLSDSDFSLFLHSLPQIAAAPSCMSSATDPATSPAFTDYTLPDATNPKIVPYAAETSNKKRPQGTTGTIPCDECGRMFTALSSLYRHNKNIHGKDTARKPSSTRRKITKAKDARLAASYNNPSLSVVKSTVTPPEEQNKFERLDSTSLNLSAPSTPTDSPGVDHAIPMLDPATFTSYIQQPHSTEYYVPARWDTSADHKSFFCDLCPATFERRDILQMHKARTHGLTEIGYLQAMGTIDLPLYLMDVAPNTGNQHHRRALKVFEHGGLSSSPCQLCLSKGVSCIVNPVSSSKCCYCHRCETGKYCGAAGVKWT